MLPTIGIIMSPHFLCVCVCACMFACVYLCVFRFFFGKNKVMASAMGKSPSDEHQPELHRLARVSGSTMSCCSVYRYNTLRGRNAQMCTLKHLLSGRLRYGHFSLPGTFSLSSYVKNASKLGGLNFFLYAHVLICHCQPVSSPHFYQWILLHPEHVQYAPNKLLQQNDVIHGR